MQKITEKLRTSAVGLRKFLVFLTVVREKGAKKLQVQTDSKPGRKNISYIWGNFNNFDKKNLMFKGIKL